MRDDSAASARRYRRCDSGLGEPRRADRADALPANNGPADPTAPAGARVGHDRWRRDRRLVAVSGRQRPAAKWIAVRVPRDRTQLATTASGGGRLHELGHGWLGAERAEAEFSRLDLRFQSLWGRPLQLIDCQNVFCEVSKYARVAHPEVTGESDRTRIKQKYTLRPAPIPQWYPPKWGLQIDSMASTSSGGGVPKRRPGTRKPAEAARR